MKVILASNSPRRRELFGRICSDFAVLPADADERLPAGTPPDEGVRLLAERKARAVYERAGKSEPTVVLGADTVVALDDRILGKPKDEADARRMLALLSGRTHAVYTGICFLSSAGKKEAVVRSLVTFKTLSARDIADYVATGSPLDKAGAYGIQDGVLVQGYEGSYTNIVGLPTEETERLYREVMQEC